MLRTRIPRGRGVRRFKFDPLTSGEIQTLQSVPRGADAHLDNYALDIGIGPSRLDTEEGRDGLDRPWRGTAAGQASRSMRGGA